MTGRPPPLLLRADADPLIGAGHVVRSLALAQAWRDRGGAAAFVGRCTHPWLVDLLRREGLDVHTLEASYPDARDLAGTLAAAARLEGSGPAWVAVDGYAFDESYHRALRKSGLRVAVIDDLAHLPAYDADLVVNPNLSFEALEYRTEGLLCGGPHAALLRREFRSRAARAPIPARANRFLVLTGGGDAEGVGPRLLGAIRAAGWGDGEGRFVVGPLAAGEDNAPTVASLGPGWRAVRGFDGMPELMAWADLAVTAGGGSVLELASVGTPSLAVVTASNQAASTRSLAALGALEVLARNDDPGGERAAPALRRLREDAEARGRMSSLGRHMVDGNGATRVARAIAALAEPRGEGDLALRAAVPEDAFLLWRWASDPVVRRNSFSQAPIPWEAHLGWLSRKFASPESRLFVLEVCAVPAATIRYDRVDAGTARISFSVAASFRGRGLGTKLLRISAPCAARELCVKTLEGKVLPGNEASVRAFLSAGFREETAGGETPPARVFRRSAAETGDLDGR